MHRWPWNTTLNIYCNYVRVYPRHIQRKNIRRDKLTSLTRSMVSVLAQHPFVTMCSFYPQYVDSWNFAFHCFVFQFSFSSFSHCMMSWMTHLTVVGKQCCSWNVEVLVSSVVPGLEPEHEIIGSPVNRNALMDSCQMQSASNWYVKKFNMISLTG